MAKHWTTVGYDPDSDPALDGESARDSDERGWREATEQMENCLRSIKEECLCDENDLHSTEYLYEAVERLKRAGYEPFPGRTAGKKNWSQGEIEDRYADLEYAMRQVAALVFLPDGTYNPEAPGLIEGTINFVLGEN
jgi:hypothetical protein